MMDAFQYAADRVHTDAYYREPAATAEHRARMRDLSLFKEVASEMSRFFAAYGSASQKTKKSLVKGLADFVIEVASKSPDDSTSATAQAEAVELLCIALAQGIQDKSLIPANFSTRLTEASEKLSRLHGGDRYEAAIYKAVSEIATVARQFSRTSTPRQIKAQL